MVCSKKRKLSAAIGFKTWREGLAREQAQETRFELDFVDIEPIHRAFAPMARELRFDVSEMAVITALQALAYDKKLMLLPVTLAARFQHGCLISLADRPIEPGRLAGRKVAVRAYTQTTGVWVRGILQNDYGVAASSIDWVTQEGAHLAEYRNPPWVHQADTDRALVDLLRAGEIDAAILGNDLPDAPDLVPVIAHPVEAAASWYARHHVVPTNHVMVVRTDVAEADPEAIRALWRCLLRAKPAPRGGVDFAAIGIAAHRGPLEMLLRFCDQQSLLPRNLDFDEIYAPARTLLGDLIQE
jgi:4,5-dihydroxyphthalate decarboxylase